MKTLLIMVLIFLFPLAVTADKRSNFFGAGEIGPGEGKKTYRTLKRCLQEHNECFDLGVKDPAIHKIVKVDDLSRPKFSKADTEACDGDKDCKSKLKDKDCSTADAKAFAVINKGYSEVYCAAPNGYKKKNAVKVDPALKAANLAAKKAKKDETLAKKAKRQSRLTALKSCAKASDFTDQELKDCIKLLSKEIARGKLKASEM